MKRELILDKTLLSSNGKISVAVECNNREPSQQSVAQIQQVSVNNREIKNFLSHIQVMCSYRLAPNVGCIKFGYSSIVDIMIS